MRNTVVTLQALAAEELINGNLLSFPMQENILPRMIYEQLCDLVALRNNLSHKFRKVFQKYDKNLSFFH